MAPLNNSAVVHITPNMRNIFAPHCDKAYTVGLTPHYHQLLKLYVPTTRGHQISGTYRLDPSHGALPVVSEQHSTISAGVNLPAAFQKFIPTSALDKQKNIAAVRKIAAIICDNHLQREIVDKSPRVDNTEQQSVYDATPLRVEPKPAPRVISGVTPSNSIM